MRPRAPLTRRRPHMYHPLHNPWEHSHSTGNHPRVFVRHQWNRLLQHQHHHGSASGGQYGNRHHTFHVPHPLLLSQIPPPPRSLSDFHAQRCSTQHMAVPYTAPSQLPSNDPILLQQSNDLTHQPGNIHHPPASLSQRLDHPPNLPDSSSQQSAHHPNWLACFPHQQTGLPQWLTHHLHQHSHEHSQQWPGQHTDQQTHQHDRRHSHERFRQRFHEQTYQHDRRHSHERSHQRSHEQTHQHDRWHSHERSHQRSHEQTHQHDRRHSHERSHQRSHEQTHQLDRRHSHERSHQRSYEQTHQRTHEHSHLSVQPAHVTDESDHNHIQGQIPGYLQTTSTHSSNTHSMRHTHPEQSGAVQPVSQEQGVDSTARDGNQDMAGMAEQRRDRRPRGLCSASISDLPSHRFRSDSQTSGQTQCVVCLFEFEESQLISSLPCSHEFHASCIDKWLRTNRTCPICRADPLQGNTG